MNNVLEISKNECTGCTACYSICKCHAIEMAQGKKGTFLRQVINEKCIDCGQCLKVCPIANKGKVESSYKKNTYAVKHLDEHVRMESTSGGAFTAFADCLIKKQAIIYGAAYYNRTVQHLRIEDGEISILRKSKYVQSYLGDCFQNIIADLKANRYVLFCGNPCQCDGLKKLVEQMRVDSTKLFVIDFICHGVLSPAIFEDYLTWCEHKSKKKIKTHIFRSKEDGWHTAKSKVMYDDKTTDSGLNIQSIMKLFYSGLGFKESCYTCSYASMERVSDITLGDFWGIEKRKPDLDDNKGLSFVMINTVKGQSLFEEAKDEIMAYQTPVDWTEQPHLKHPLKKPDNGDLFWEYYSKNSIERTFNKFLYGGLVRGFFRAIWHKIR